MKLKIAVLAVSNKRRHNDDYGRCVAGVTENGEWIRLVADKDGDSLPVNTGLRPMSLIEANVEYAPLVHQPENAVLIDYRFAGGDIKNYLAALKPCLERYVFGNPSNRLNENEMREVRGSLRLILVRNLEIYSSGRWKVRFTYNECDYADIAMTDPKHYRNERFDSAYILVSLPNAERCYGGYYKFAAAIYPVYHSPGTRRTN
ncbi:MAG: hypothetical protein FWC55_04315 [Firmicutes bacterium]|nr:hypothetical protein [Bacillota bacterium]